MRKSIQHLRKSIQRLRKSKQKVRQSIQKVRTSIQTLRKTSGTKAFKVEGVPPIKKDDIIMSIGTYARATEVKKNKGKTTGWIGYTLSWTNRKFENINFGDWFPYKYDRRHDFSLVISHKFNDKWDIGATWVYGTGNAITFPQGIYFGMPSSSGWNDQLYVESVESYGGRNSTRLPSYHRLDFALNKNSNKKRFSSTWSFGAYNIYNRK